MSEVDAGAAEEREDKDGGEEELADHFAALRMLPDRRVGIALWIAAHLLCVTIALVTWTLLVGGSALFLAVAGEFVNADREGVEGARDVAPIVWKVLLAALAIGLLCVLATRAVLKAGVRRLPATFRFPAPPAPRRAPRETRREAAARAKRSGRIGLLAGLLGALAAGSAVLALSWPSMAPWEAGSAPALLGHLLLAALTGLAVLAGCFAALLFGYLLLMTVGWVRQPFADRLLPSRARVRVARPPAPRRAPTPPLAESDGSPSPSLLVYLFADRLLDADRVHRLGAPVPCAGREVKAVDLATTLFVAAFWNLREHEAIRLELGRRRLPFGRRRVEVTRTRAERWPGLEGALMGIPNTDPEALSDEDTSGMPGPLGDVREAIGAWFRSQVEDPEWQVIEAVLDQAVERGLILKGEDGKRPCLRCAAIAREEPAFAPFAARWRRFEAQEPALWAALRRECAKAIGAARSYPEADGLFKLMLLMAMRLWERADRDWPREAEEVDVATTG